MHGVIVGAASTAQLFGISLAALAVSIAGTVLNARDQRRRSSADERSELRTELAECRQLREQLEEALLSATKELERQRRDNVALMRQVLKMGTDSE